MEESITYQEILLKGIASGRLNEAREINLLLGADRFVQADEKTVENLNSIADVKQLHQLCVRLTHVDSWNDLFE